MGAFGLTDIPGHIMTNNQVNGSYNNYYCSCGATLYISVKKDGTANAWGKREWKDHCDVVQTPDDFYVEIGSVQKSRVKWDVRVMSTNHPDYVKYQVPAHAYWMHWYQRELAQNSNFKAFAVCVAKSGKSKWTVNRVTDSRDAALKIAADIVRKASNNPDHVAELTHGDGTPVVEVVSVDICKATSQILNEADEAVTNGDLFVIMAKRRELQDILNMRPLLEAKLSELNLAVSNSISETTDRYLESSTP